MALAAIADGERHGRPRDLFPLWFGANAETATFATGILAVALYGTSLRGALLGLAIGNLLAYAVVDTIFGAQALGMLAGLAYPVALALLLAAQIALAVYGHNAIHAFERVASIALLAGFAVVAVAVFAHGPLAGGFDSRAPLAAGGEGAGIVFSAALAFAYAIGWVPCASDYARYLPPESNLRAVAAVAIHAPALTSATPAETIRLVANGNAVVAAIGLATVLFGTLSANALNLYSGALSALIAYDAQRRLGFAALVGITFAALTALVLPPGYALAIGALCFVVVRWTLARWQAAVAVGLFGGALALAGGDPAATARLFAGFLGVLTAALAAWGAGIAASIPFWQQAWFVGPLARAFPQLGDLSFFVGFTTALAVAALITSLESRQPTAGTYGADRSNGPTR